MAAICSKYESTIQYVVLMHWRLPVLNYGEYHASLCWQLCLPKLLCWQTGHVTLNTRPTPTRKKRPLGESKDSFPPPLLHLGPPCSSLPSLPAHPCSRLYKWSGGQPSEATSSPTIPPPGVLRR
jgi:hypothetical protein